MIASAVLFLEPPRGPGQPLHQILCRIGECLRLCHHLLETSTSDLLRQNRLNKKTKYFLQLPRQPHTGLRLLLSKGSQLSPHSDNLEEGLSLQVTDNQIQDNQIPDNQIQDNQSNPDSLMP